MDKVLFDSSAQFALFDPTDQNHIVAQKIYKQLQDKRSRLVVTDYLIDETLTLITTRRGKRHAIEYSQKMPATDIDLVFVTESDFYQAKDIFERYRDKPWSFTDCVSFALMRRLGINTAFSFDRNFSQAGFNLLK